MFTNEPRRDYGSDLTDEQWALMASMIPKENTGKQGGRPREVSMREVINTILYLVRTGCQWDMLPHDLLPKSTVYGYFAQWRDDGTWQRMVDTLGLLLAVLITGANVDDGTAAPLLLEQVTQEEFPRLKLIFGDSKYRNKRLQACPLANAKWARSVQAWEVEVKGKTEREPRLHAGQEALGR